MIFFFLLLVLVLIAQIAEFFIPALPWLYNAHIYIVPVIVFYGAMLNDHIPARLSCFYS